MRPPMEELARLYHRRTGRRVEFDFGDSGELFAKIDITKKGDVFVCHDPFLVLVKKRGLCDRAWTVASLKPVIVVRKGNPKGIKGLRDLFKPGVKVGLPHPKYSTCGNILKFVILKKAGLEEEARRRTATYSRHHAELANSVMMGALDAAIVWDAVARPRRKALDIIEIEPEYAAKPGVDTVTTATYGPVDMGYIRVTVITLTCSKQIELARDFAKFCASPEGRRIFRKHGFSPPLEEGRPEGSQP